jgi:hypothetical protein
VKNPFLWLALAVVILAGCATNRPVIATSRDAHFSPARTDKIALTLRTWPAADVELGRILTAELERAGFHLVPLAEADYVLTYVVEDVNEVAYRPTEPLFLSLPPQTDRERFRNENYPRPYPQPLPPTKVVFVKKKIRLDLATNPKTGAGGPQTVWTGRIDAGEKVSLTRTPQLIEALLGYFGKDYSGRTELVK